MRFTTYNIIYLISNFFPDSAKLKTLQRVSKKCESSHYIFREQGGVYEREQ